MVQNSRHRSVSSEVSLLWEQLPVALAALRTLQGFLLLKMCCSMPVFSFYVVHTALHFAFFIGIYSDCSLQAPLCYMSWDRPFQRSDSACQGAVFIKSHPDQELALDSGPPSAGWALLAEESVVVWFLPDWVTRVKRRTGLPWATAVKEHTPRPGALGALDCVVPCGRAEVSAGLMADEFEAEVAAQSPLLLSWEQIVGRMPDCWKSTRNWSFGARLCLFIHLPLVW